MRSASCVHGVGIADVADGVDARRHPCRSQLVSKRRDGFGVDVGEHHRHAESRGVPGQSGADARTGAGDDGDAAAERLASAHAASEPAAAAALLYSANGTESSASRTTFIEVNTRPSAPRRTPTSTTPLDTSNGTLLVTWLTNR